MATRGSGAFEKEDPFGAGRSLHGRSEDSSGIDLVGDFPVHRFLRRMFGKFGEKPRGIGKKLYGGSQAVSRKNRLPKGKVSPIVGEQGKTTLRERGRQSGFSGSRDSSEEQAVAIAIETSAMQRGYPEGGANEANGDGEELRIPE